MLKKAGLDPEIAPANWDEMVDFGKKLTKKDANGNVSQWGVRIPSAGYPYWVFQGLSTPAGAIPFPVKPNCTRKGDFNISPSWRLIK